MLLASPAGWAALVLPALDLARVALLRARAGEPPWRGDRRHLAHRAQRAGWGRTRVALALALVAAPAALGAALDRGGPGPAALGGSLATAALFALAVRATKRGA